MSHLKGHVPGQDSTYSLLVPLPLMHLGNMGGVSDEVLGFGLAQPWLL